MKLCLELVKEDGMYYWKFEQEGVYFVSKGFCSEYSAVGALGNNCMWTERYLCESELKLKEQPA